ncbi:MAG: PTS sugar transporter subunit IIC, partial [Clostridia bacterium]|nr:PTS sugar transporter subunit IIC [Clostridia bacterium]
LASSTIDPTMIDAMYLAGGAATVGCACQMVGFAVQSFRENRWGGLIAQGIGTSMLQIPNLMRHPIIIVPPIIASAIAGPLSTVVFGLRCGAAGGGMGTSGLVGVFDVISASQGVIADWKIGVGIIVCMFVIPVVVCLLVSELFRKFNLIKLNDMKLEL